MNNSLREIICLPECNCLTLAAGKAGLDRQVKWTILIGVDDSSEYISEGDLIFVTSIGNTQQLLNLTSSGYVRKAAGIIFVTATTTLSIPNEVVKFGDSHNFPVFTMPREIHISTITSAIGKCLANTNEERRNTHDILQAILMKKEPLPLSSSVKDKLKYYSISEISSYRVLLFKPVHKMLGNEIQPATNDEIDAACKEVQKNMMHVYYINAIPIKLSSTIAFLLINNSINYINEELIDEILCIVKKTEAKFNNLNLIIGIGKAYNQIEDAGNSFQEALWVTSIIPSKIQYEKSLYHYDQLGAYRIICEHENKECLEKFHHDTIGFLDTKCGEGSIKFLKDYFECNGNISFMSKKLFIHRNTVLYKLKKIEKNLNCNFLLLEDLLNIKLAIMIDEVLHKSEVYSDYKTLNDSQSEYCYESGR